MTRHFSAFLLCLLALTLSACATKHHRPPSTQSAPRLAYSNWHLEKRGLDENSSGDPHYIIDVRYPEIIGHPDTASTRQLNQMILTYVRATIQDFKEHAPHNNFDYSDYPVEMLINEFSLHYNAALLKPRGHTIVSIRFETTTRFFSEAHSVHHYDVINYDLTEGKVLTLDSLFRPNSPYLQKLAHQSTTTLRHRFTQGMPWMPWNYEANLALEENFRIWNLDQQSLVITFQEYQVTPYSSQAQKIRIPYSRLRSLLSPASPVSAYAYV